MLDGAIEARAAGLVLVLSYVCDKGGAMEVSCMMNKMGQVGSSDEGMGAQQIVYRCSGGKAPS